MVAKKKELSQEQIWDLLSEPWEEFRKRPDNYVISFMKRQKGRLLDLACGSGRHIFKSDLDYYGTDFSREMLKRAEKYARERGIKASFKKSSADKIPFDDNFFDAAIYIASLHCIDSAKARMDSLRELFRVLKPKAHAFIAVWSKNQKRIKNKPKEALIPWTFEGKKYLRYYYIYDKSELESLLKKVGFKIIKSWENDNIWIEVEKP